jgi:hypothetical protein
MAEFTKAMLDEVMLKMAARPRPTHMIVSRQWMQALRRAFLRRDDRLWRKRNWGKQQ